MSDNQFEGTARKVAGKVEDTAGSLTGDVKTEVQGKADQVAGMAQHAYGEAKDAAVSAADNAQSAIGDVAKRVGAQASTLKESASTQASRAASYAGSQVREEPLIALIAAGAVGMLIGYLIGRPQHERAVEMGRFRAAYRDR